MICSVCGVSELRDDNDYGVCSHTLECRARRTAIRRERRQQELEALRALRDQVREAING